MAKAERTGAETGDRTAGAEGRVVDRGAIKRFQAVAGRIAERNQAAHAPVICKRLRLGRDFDLRQFQPGRERVQRIRIGHFPAEKPLALRHRAVDHDALLAVVHPERQQGGAPLHRLQADQSGSELPPIVERGRAEPDISQRLQWHHWPPAFLISRSCFNPGHVSRVRCATNPRSSTGAMALPPLVRGVRVKRAPAGPGGAAVP